MARTVEIPTAFAIRSSPKINCIQTGGQFRKSVLTYGFSPAASRRATSFQARRS
jgi:hypothetical protein